MIKLLTVLSVMMSVDLSFAQKSTPSFSDGSRLQCQGFYQIGSNRNTQKTIDVKPYYRRESWGESAILANGESLDKYVFGGACSTTLCRLEIHDSKAKTLSTAYGKFTNLHGEEVVRIEFGNSADNAQVALTCKLIN